MVSYTIGLHIGFIEHDLFIDELYSLLLRPRCIHCMRPTSAVFRKNNVNYEACREVFKLLVY